jgi:hypothetical protein
MKPASATASGPGQPVGCAFPPVSAVAPKLAMQEKLQKRSTQEIFGFSLSYFQLYTLENCFCCRME